MEVWNKLNYRVFHRVMVRKPNILILGGENAASAPQQHLELGCDVRTASSVTEAAGICLFTPPDLLWLPDEKPDSMTSLSN